ncbi:hypothetical protein CQW31_03440 [Pseudomonas sp. 382]|nr:hypothetical protein DZC31_26010 [Stenotrophomonas rhizophila]PIK79852.1 hypothetical protein CQW31_03440 [Pseudomonas sp. 382]
MPRWPSGRRWWQQHLWPEGPLRGHARSHRYCTGFKACAVIVGAGVPAKRPVQAATISSQACPP